MSIFALEFDPQKAFAWQIGLEMLLRFVNPGRVSPKRGSDLRAIKRSASRQQSIKFSQSKCHQSSGLNAKFTRYKNIKNTRPRLFIKRPLGLHAVWFRGCCWSVVRLSTVCGQIDRPRPQRSMNFSSDFEIAFLVWEILGAFECGSHYAIP